jgi:tetratricopeptide (TPR) repeat protein
MAEALALIGLASAIVQFVEVGTRLLNRLHEFSDDVGNMPKVFQDTKTRLPLIMNTLMRTKEQAEAATFPGPATSALHPLIDGCTEQVELLYSIVDRNLPSPKASTWERRLKALKSMAVDKDVQKIIALLDRNIQALIFHQTTASLDNITLNTTSSTRRDRISPEAYWVVPFLQNPKFVGRSSVIQELEAKLGQDVNGRRLALAGLGGVGKSQVAVEMAYRTRDRCPGCSVFWVPATSPEAFEAAYLEIGRQLSINGLTDPAVDVKGLVKARLSDEAIGKWFMIVDNADDLNMLLKNIGSEMQPVTLMDYLPRTSHGDILFTTRDRKVAVKLARTNVITISEMDEDAAEELLRKSIIDTDILHDSEATRSFLRQLTCLPLAIVQAAAYIDENMISVGEYLDMLVGTEETAVELLSEDFEDDGRYRESKNPVATTWQISFEQIRSRDPLAARYLSFMACFDPKNIPLRLLPTETSKKKQTDAFGTLKAYSFVTVRSDEAFDLHRLVHMATRNWLVMENSLGDYTQQATERLAEEFPPGKHEKKAIWTALMPHAQYVLASPLAVESKERYELMQKVSLCLSADGKYEEAVRLQTKTLTWSEQTLGIEHPETAIHVQLLAKLMQSMGNYDEAVELNVRALAMLKNLHGSNHTSVLTTLNNLAMNYQSQGRLIEAQELFKQVVEESKLQLGEEHAETLKSIGNLATNYTTLGDWAQAEEMLLKATEVSKRINGPEHPETLLYMNNLSVTYNFQRKLDQSQAMAKQTLELRTKVLGRDHPDTLFTVNNLALSYMNQERINEAGALFEEVIRVSTKLQGKDHPDTLIARSNLASIYLAKYDWKKAEEQFVQVLETRRSFLGRYHMKTINIAARLAFVYHESGQTGKAEELRMEVEAATTLLMMQGIAPAWVTFRNTDDPAGFWEVVRKICSPEARKHGIKVFTG